MLLLSLAQATASVVTFSQLHRLSRMPTAERTEYTVQIYEEVVKTPNLNILIAKSVKV